ncbi:hypothetical protein GCM10020216_030430 [Nonomuraea helvata]
MKRLITLPTVQEDFDESGADLPSGYRPRGQYARATTLADGAVLDAIGPMGWVHMACTRAMVAMAHSHP